MKSLLYAQAAFLGRAAIRFDAAVTGSDLTWKSAFFRLVELRLRVIETEADHLAALVAYDRWEASGAPENESDFEAWELASEFFIEASDVLDDAKTAWFEAWQYKLVNPENVTFQDASVAVGLGWEVEA